MEHEIIGAFIVKGNESKFVIKRGKIPSNDSYVLWRGVEMFSAVGSWEK